jgi:hypothetical protein
MIRKIAGGILLVGVILYVAKHPGTSAGALKSFGSKGGDVLDGLFTFLTGLAS